MEYNKEIRTAGDFQQVVENAIMELWKNTGITVDTININARFAIPKELQTVCTKISYKS